MTRNAGGNESSSKEPVSGRQILKIRSKSNGVAN